MTGLYIAIVSIVIIGAIFLFFFVRNSKKAAEIVDNTQTDAEEEIISAKAWAKNHNLVWTPFYVKKNGVYYTLYFTTKDSCGIVRLSSKTNQFYIEYHKELFEELKARIQDDSDEYVIAVL